MIPQPPKTFVLPAGEIAFSRDLILKTSIGTCAVICFYHPTLRCGGMTHISRSRLDDTTPSGRFLKNGGYYYADSAIEGILEEFKKVERDLDESSLCCALFGGLQNEGPIRETLLELAKHPFQILHQDINQGLFRTISFDTAAGQIKLERKKPLEDGEIEVRMVELKIDE